jgi:hypothetical protein
MRQGMEAEIQELLAPIGVWIPQSLDVDTARHASFHGCLDELGRKGGK